MPSFRTYRDDKAIYSVDMMLAYLNTHKHPVKKITVESLKGQLSQPVWGEWSPMDVIERPGLKRWAEDAQRIKDADLSYPIIVTSKGTIVDGYHRAAKALATGATEIKAQVFDAAMMRKFILDKDLNFVRVHQKMTVYEVLELYARRFC